MAWVYIYVYICFPGSPDGKTSAYNAGDPGPIPGLGRSSGEGNGNPLQYSCLENPMGCGAWWATAMGSQRAGHDYVTSLHFTSYAVKVLHSICQQIWKTQQWPQDWKRSVFIPIPKKGNAKECSNYRTIALISHASQVMLKILQARLQQYVNHELPDVEA